MLPKASLQQIAQRCQAIARFLGDKQNSDFSLKSTQCTKIVNVCLDAGNVLEQIARELPDDPTPPAESTPLQPSTDVPS